MTISLAESRFEALVTLDAAREVHACLAIYTGFTRGILSPYSRLCKLVCGYIVNKMQPGRWRRRKVDEREGGWGAIIMQRP